MKTLLEKELKNKIIDFFEIDDENIELNKELPLDFKVEGHSSSGSLYTNYIGYTAYVVNENGIVEIPEKLITPHNMSNADGTWTDSFGYDFDYIAKQAIIREKSPLFIIIKTEWCDACHGSRDEGVVLEIYKAPNFMKRLIEIEKKSIKKWGKWLNE